VNEQKKVFRAAAAADIFRPLRALDFVVIGVVMQTFQSSWILQFQKRKPIKCTTFVLFTMFLFTVFLQHVSASCHLQGGYIIYIKHLKHYKYAISAIIKIFLKC
jgi:hypothetical protein